MSSRLRLSLAAIAGLLLVMTACADDDTVATTGTTATTTTVAPVTTLGPTSTIADTTTPGTSPISVAAPEVLYHERERRRLQDALTCIRHGCSINEAGRRLKPNAEHALQGPDVLCG